MKNAYVIGKHVRFVLSEKSLERISDGHKVKLRAPASFCLTLLLENQGSMVKHDELCYYGWERFGMAASLSVLHNTIYYLRKVLNETGKFDSNIIETINRRGFIFSLKISVESEVLNHKNSETLESEADEPNNIISNKYEASFEKKIEKESFDQDLLKGFIGFSNQTILTGKEISNYQFFGENEWEQLNPASEIYENKKVTVDIKKSSTEDRLKKVFKFKRNGSCEFIFMAIFAVLSCLMGLIIFTGHSVKDSSVSSYVYMGKLDMCDVYQNNVAYNYTNLRAADYLRGFCKEKRSLYLTFYPYTNKLSAINCKAKISFFSDDICFSNYFIFDNKGLKSV